MTNSVRWILRLWCLSTFCASILMLLVVSTFAADNDEVFKGVVVNLKGDTFELNTDPLDPNQRKSIDRKEIVSIEPSKTSPMPTGLLDLLNEQEILDLLAYIISGGDSAHDLFHIGARSKP